MTNLKTLSLVVVFTLLLQACSEKAPTNIVRNEPSNQAEYADSKRHVSKYLAYEHNVTTEVKNGDLSALHQRIVKQCFEDAQFNCVVLESSLTSNSFASSSIRLRLLPEGVTSFTILLAGSGDITSNSSKAEDLSDSIVDVKKRIDMLELHHSRLLELEAKEGGNIDELLKIVTELAKVQNQLEYARGKEAKLVTRVSNDLLNIRLKVLQNESTWNPLSNAFNNFSDDFIYALSDVVSFCAMIIPWLPVVIFLMLLLRFVWGFFRRKRT